MQSIITKDSNHCLICGSSNNIEIHHIMFGAANRPLSTKYGLVAPLCRGHHTGFNGVHCRRELDLKLKQIAQKKFKEAYPDKEWMDIFHKNYL